MANSSGGNLPSSDKSNPSSVVKKGHQGIYEYGGINQNGELSIDVSNVVQIRSDTSSSGLNGMNLKSNRLKK